jgi:predicted anti-sigma-YlaC factor YlaD
MHRALRVSAAETVPDLTVPILAAIGAQPTDTPNDTALRWSLVLLAVLQIAIALPDLLGTASGISIHNAHHIGSFDVALAVGFLFVAWRPTRSIGLLPVVVALVVCLLLTSILDVAAGSTPALSEAQHVTDYAGLAIIWCFSRTARAAASTPLPA